jgi:hypothetical protein
LILLAALTRLRLSALLSRLLAALTRLLTGLLLTTAALLATLTATTLVLLVGPLFVRHDFTPCMAARRDTNKSGDAMFRWRWRSRSPPSVIYRTDAKHAAVEAQLAPARLLEKTPPRDQP